MTEHRTNTSAEPKCNFAQPGFVNLGTGKDLPIKELAGMIKDIVNFAGVIVWDSTKPNGTPRKLMDVTKMEKPGRKHSISLAEGLAKLTK